MPEPLISVVMPVCNALPYLNQSIECILKQTLEDFELVILNDSSTDGSESVLREWKQRDSRISIYESTERLGLAGSANRVISHSRAALVARMDADDRCEPDRLRRQWEVMRNNPQVVVVGTLCDGIDAHGRRIRPRDRWRINRRSAFPPFPHGSVMMRREVFDRIGGYRLNWIEREDQDLFRRMSAHGLVVTLPEVLYHYRYHLQSWTATNETSSNASTDSREQLSSLYSAAAMRLWAGHSPAILKSLLTDDSLGWSFRRCLVTAWAFWGSMHPQSLRSAAGVMLRLRDLLAGTRISDGRFYEWRFE